jgi:hypothetical protein
MQSISKLLTPALIVIVLLLTINGTTVQAIPGRLSPSTAVLGTAFTYQGQLKQNGTTVTTTCDLQFGLWDALAAGTQIGTTQTKTNVSVANGIFTIPDLDFGVSAFDGNARWLELAVRCPAGSGSFAPLSPRQALTATPYALYAASAPPTAGSTNYIQNTSAPQIGASFNIDGNGTLGGTLSASKVGIGTPNPSTALSLDGQSGQTIGMERNSTSNSAGNSLTIQAGSATAGATDKAGGDLALQPGVGTGLGASGNIHVLTAGASTTSGTSDNTLVDRVIVVSKAKQLTLAAPGFTSLMSIHLVGTQTAGGRIRYTVRATDGGSQIATESGVIQFLATANSITCTVQATDKLHLGTVNSGCTPGFFNPGSQPGVSIFDNVSFSSPAPIVVHEVYFTIENESGSAIRLEP